MITKLCSRCNEIKPACEFTLNVEMLDGLGSHCRLCRREVRQESKDRYPHQRQQQAEEKKLNLQHYEDPTRYSRAVCGHVAEYVDRAVLRFEERTGKEAPPHMVALLQIANSFVEEHQEQGAPRVARCAQCGVTYTRKLRNRYRICPSCSRERRRADQREKYSRRREKVEAA